MTDDNVKFQFFFLRHLVKWLKKSHKLLIPILFIPHPSANFIRFHSIVHILNHVKSPKTFRMFIASKIENKNFLPTTILLFTLIEMSCLKFSKGCPFAFYLLLYKLNDCSSCPRHVGRLFEIQRFFQRAHEQLECLEFPLRAVLKFFSSSRLTCF